MRSFILVLLLLLFSSKIHAQSMYITLTGPAQWVVTYPDLVMPPWEHQALFENPDYFEDGSIGFKWLDRDNKNMIYVEVDFGNIVSEYPLTYRARNMLITPEGSWDGTFSMNDNIDRYIDVLGFSGHSTDYMAHPDAPNFFWTGLGERDVWCGYLSSFSSTAPVPEPASIALLGLGVCVTFFWNIRKNNLTA